MKNIYSWAIALLIGATTTAQTQNLPSVSGSLNIQSPYANRDFSEKAPTYKLTQCTDTVLYVANKDQTGVGFLPLANGGAYIEEGYQAYRYDWSNAPARIIGVRAWALTDLDGVAGSNPDISASLNVYSVDGSNAPVSLIASESIVVQDLAGYPLVNYIFSTPISVNGSFSVSIEIGSSAAITDTIWMFTTGNGDGLGENLAYADVPSFGGPQSLLNFFGLDADIYIMPIMEYDLTADFYLDDNCLEQGDDIYTNNMSEVVADPMFNAGMLFGAPAYYWDFGDGNISGNWDDQNYYPAPGNYTVTFSDTLYGWTATCGESFSEVVSVIGAQVSVTDATCGINDGTASVTTMGGFTPYSYVWMDQSFTPTGETDQMLTGLSAGLVIVNVVDANGCDAMTGNTISNIGAPSITVTTVPETCPGTSDASASVVATGGSIPYTYNWFDIFTSQEVGTSSTVSGLAETVLTVTVEDALGCQATSIVFLGSPNGPLESDTWSQDASAMGASDGEVVVWAWGGASPYTYLWSNSSTSDYQSGLPAGTYDVTISDANGCEVYNSALIQEPGICGFIYNYELNPETCGDEQGAIYNTYVTGGIGSFDYIWEDGETTTDRYNLMAGDYSVTITDQGTACADVMTITVPGSMGVEFYITTTEATCGGSDGDASVVIIGGTSPYTYTWFDVNFTPTGETTQMITGLPASVVIVQVDDANGCSETEGAAINNIGAPAITVTSTSITCNGSSDGTVSATASGGVTPYSYAWSELETGTSSGTSQSLSGLDKGVYIVTVTDAIGCVSIEGLDVEEPDSIYVDTYVGDVWCASGSEGEVLTYVWGGISPYSYAWSTGSTTQNLTGIMAGVYSLTVTDASACSQERSYTVSEPLAIALTITFNDATCGNSDGDATVTVSNGVGAYYYDWSDGQNSQTANNLMSGVYDVTVYDDNGCESASTVIISNSDGPQVSISVTDITCNGNNDGIATANVTGGTTGYTYFWNSTSTTSSINGLSVSLIALTVTDGSGCEGFAVGSIAEPDLVAVNVTVTNETTAAASDGTAIALATGGDNSFTYNWGAAGTGASLTNLTPGAYSVTATDGNGCFSVENVTVIAGNPCDTTMLNLTMFSNCSPDETGVVVTGGATPYTFLWSTGDINDTISSFLPGSMIWVTVTDVNLCSAVDSIVVCWASVEELSNSISFKLYPNPNNGNFTVSVSQQGDYTVIVRNVIGQQVASIALNGKLTEEVNLQNADAGIYFVTIKSEGFEKTQRIIIR
ncbi:MAG: T9SS type A sorting domain-containing protein [Flavobacteriales bacterium]|nr:T9SS type A sorting domain-containing protein [Flavobacteriales bacterium]